MSKSSTSNLFCEYLPSLPYIWPYTYIDILCVCHQSQVMSTFMVSDNTTLQACQNNFGPTASGCRNDFDFTLLFEQSLLSIGPSALFLLLMPIRTLQLSKKSYKVRRSPLHSLKLVSTPALAYIGPKRFDLEICN